MWISYTIYISDLFFVLDYVVQCVLYADETAPSTSSKDINDFTVHRFTRPAAYQLLLAGLEITDSL
jgi:hypothetical protein